MASLRLLRFAPPSPRTFANIREDWAQEPAAPCLLFGVSQPSLELRPRLKCRRCRMKAARIAVLPPV